MSQIEVVHLLPSIQKQQKKYTNQHSYAPFLSTVNKSFDEKKSISPGPAYYGRQLRKIQHQNKRQITNSSIQKQGSAAFQDESTRFRIQKSNSPGPAHYSPQPFKKQTTSNKKISNAFEQYRTKFPEMYSQYKSVSIHSYTTNPKKQIKQQQQQSLSKPKQKYHKCVDWSKSKEQRFKSQHEDNNVPGPGFYYIPNSKQLEKGKNYISPQFMSASPRSYLDNTFDSRSEAVNNSYQVQKKDQPGPGSYNVEGHFQMNKYVSNARLLLSSEVTKNLRNRKAKLNNLSNLLSKSSSYNSIQPMLKIKQIHPMNI